MMCAYALWYTPAKAARAALHVDGEELAGLGIGGDEERVEDAQRAAALHPLQGATSWPSKAASGPDRYTRSCLAGRVGWPVILRA
jgi:hypothetical protein